jgi:hypothetical protein
MFKTCEISAEKYFKKYFKNIEKFPSQWNVEHNFSFSTRAEQ